jgi:peptidoglycan/LPS O-acetylase OafA/YrhL
VSLGIEEQFYILFPYFLYFCLKHKLRVISMIVLPLSASFLLNIILRVPQPIADFYCPATRFWELLTGAALAAAYRYDPPVLRRIVHKADQLLAKVFREEGVPDDGRAAATALSLAGLLCIAVSIFATAEPKRFPGWQAVLPVAGTVLVLHAGERAFTNGRILANRVVAALGRISYPLYLWHWPLLSFAFIINGGKPGRMVRIVLVAASVSLAFLTWRFFEQPIRFGARAVWIKTAMLCVFIAVMGTCGL